MKTTFIYKYQTSRRWQNKCRIIALYHHTQRLKHRRWGIRATALYFGLGKSMVANAIRLSEHYDEVKDCKTRNEAMAKLGIIKENDND